MQSKNANEKLIQKSKSEEIGVLMEKGLTREQAKKLADVFDLSAQAFAECGKFASLLGGNTIVDDEVSFAVREVFVKLMQIGVYSYEISVSNETKKLFDKAVEELPDEQKRMFDAIEKAVSEEDNFNSQRDFEGVTIH